MKKELIQTMILPEIGYENAMETIVHPYLAQRKTEHCCERETGRQIYYVRCLADRPRGVAVISHGFSETIEKYMENIYYFVRGGYHVYMPEHCGHGNSYRVRSDPKNLSLIHVDDYTRYVFDLLYIADIAARSFPDLPLLLYGHSMGGGIAAAAASRAPNLFSRLVLSSPMIRPDTSPVPWPLAKLIARGFCAVGKSERLARKSCLREGPERFADSASVSEARFDYYQEIRRREPLYQMHAASCGWLWQAARLNRYLQKEAWRRIACPTLVFQSERETFVSNREQMRFVRKLSRKNPNRVRLIRVPGTRHEIFNSENDVLERYWKKILYPPFTL